MKHLQCVLVHEVNSFNGNFMGTRKHSSIAVVEAYIPNYFSCVIFSVLIQYKVLTKTLISLYMNRSKYAPIAKVITRK